MKKLLLAVLMVLPFGILSQNQKKTFLTILDEYITNEPKRIGLKSDSILFYVVFDEIKEGYAINLCMYHLLDYPKVDSLKMYKGYHILVDYPEKLNRKLNKCFQSIEDKRKYAEEQPSKMIESKSSFLFQIKKNNRIYIFSTTDDEYYYRLLKFKKLKFTKDVKFTRDLYTPRE